MKNRLLKISVILIVSGLAVFVFSASIIELAHFISNSDDVFLPQNMAWLNTISIFIGIPMFLVGMAFMIGNFVPKFSSLQVVSLIGICFVASWILLIISRFS